MHAMSFAMRNETTSRWFSLAIASQLCLGIYFELCAWVPLGAWNDQPGRAESTTFGEALFNLFFGLAPMLFSLAFLKRIRPLMWLGLIFHAIWLAIQVLSWWVPYLFGASPQHMEMYNRVFGRTYNFLPSFENHPAPDAMHFVLQVLLVSVVMSCAGALLRGREHA